MQVVHLFAQRHPQQYSIALSHMIIHDTLLTGETHREEATRELDRNEERVEEDAKQHPS
jgi:hypothetical protein